MSAYLQLKMLFALFQIEWVQKNVQHGEKSLSGQRCGTSGLGAITAQQQKTKPSW